jgi:hypothetical protein
MDLVDFVLQRVCDSVARDTKFEEFLAVYFSLVFGPGVRLCDIFSFGKEIPTWAQTDYTELVALSSSGYLRRKYHT